MQLHLLDVIYAYVVNSAMLRHYSTREEQRGCAHMWRCSTEVSLEAFAQIASHQTHSGLEEEKIKERKIFFTVDGHI